MTAAALLDRARAAGFSFTLLPGMRVKVHPTPPDDILSALRAERIAIALFLAAQTAPPAEPVALLDYVRDILGCHLSIDTDQTLRITPTHYCPPRVLAAIQQHEAAIRELLSGSSDLNAVAGPRLAR